MATVEDCEQALHDLARQLSDRDPSSKRQSLDRSLSCTIRDLDIVFAGQLRDGTLHQVRQVPSNDPRAQINLDMKSEDLLKLVAGELNMATAWATGRVKVDAGIRDILKLRTLF